MAKKKKGYELLFVRHGETALNADSDKIRGWLDVPLNEKGEQEALQAGEKLKGEKIDGIITSDLIRAQQTAKTISQVTGAPIIAASKALRPWNVGVATGQPAEKVMKELHAVVHQSPDKEVPQGEAFNEFKNRYLNEIKHIKRMFADKRILIVAHHRNNVLLDAWQAAGQKPDNSIDTHVFMERGIPPAAFKIYYL